MSAISEIYIGEDKAIEIKLYQDEAKTIPIDIENDIAELGVLLYTTPSYQIKFSKNEIEGYSLLKKIDSYTYLAAVQAEQTLLLQAGQGFIYVFTAENAADFPNGYRRKKAVKSFIAINNIGKDILIQSE